ncbi:DinB family protein [Neobacillus sp. D3-1R]|uniref:DinB family protein n=1 Tax=Neobacillus sp. D3-1R TaxID=3445778 RepID=UPI003FA09CE8
MQLKELIQKQLEFSYGTEDWYPPLKDALTGLTAEQANWKPEGVAVNSIWENASHILFYKERLLAQLQGETFQHSAQDNDDTFQYCTELAWEEMLVRCNDNQNKLEKLIGSFTEEDFNKEFNGKSFSKMISSINMHDAYHTGQIIQIRKLQGSWPEKRAF